LAVRLASSLTTRMCTFCPESVVSNVGLIMVISPAFTSDSLFVLADSLLLSVNRGDKRALTDIFILKCVLVVLSLDIIWE